MGDTAVCYRLCSIVVRARMLKPACLGCRSQVLLVRNWEQSLTYSKPQEWWVLLVRYNNMGCKKFTWRKWHVKGDSKWWKNATMFYKKPKKRSYQSQHHLHHHSLATQSSAHKCILWTTGISWDQKEKMQPFLPCSMLSWASLLAQIVKDLPVNAGDLGSIPKLGRSPGEGNGNPLQYSCLENPTERGAWRATVHGFSRSQTQLSN